MYKKILYGPTNIKEYEELAKVFLMKEEFQLEIADKKPRTFEKNNLKKEMFFELQKLTGKTPPWGIVTGIRPVKLAGEIIKEQKKLLILAPEESAKKVLMDFYCVSKEKADLAVNLAVHQIEIAGVPEPKSVAIYIGIPFCPTRCQYCSFTSNVPVGNQVQEYMEALVKEIKYVGQKQKEENLYPESIYVGGGTPTALDPENLQRLLATVNENLTDQKTVEFTVEAGRPDTVTREKLEILKENKVGRISINPQTIHDKTLEVVGRNHTFTQIKDVYDMAKQMGVFDINMDLIAGLPGETLGDFVETVKTIVAMDPENITIHSLALKRASKLAKIDRHIYFRKAGVVSKMLQEGARQLKKSQYNEYYLYRQKQMAGSQENIGYCKNHKHSIYNIRIMEENQRIIALGAGGISKAYFPAENRLERVANVSNFQIYIERIDEMIQRKEKGMFAQT